MTSPAGRAYDACPGCGAPVVDSRAAGLCAACVLAGVAGEALRSGASSPEGVMLPADYDLIDTLGRGGMGVVYLVRQRALARYVALKTLASSRADHPRARERFLREARAVAGLSHPGIVAILDVGEVGPTAWYTMGYLERGDLSDLLRRRGGRLPWAEAAALVAKVAEAIQHAHRTGVAHRDLKPSNILLDVGGEPKVGDFGLAWLAGGDRTELTMSGEILGTPAYLAPEMAKADAREVDARPGDIYSLGALLFHLVAGRPPFVGTHPLGIIRAIATEAAPRLRTAAGTQVPLALEIICDRCLSKRPAARYRSAAELAEALRACGTARPGLRERWQVQRSLRIAVGMIAATAAVGVLGWSVKRWMAGNSAIAPAAAASLPMIAVMPLEVRTSDENAVLLAAGLQDELVSTLTRISNLRAMGRQSVKSAYAQTHDVLAAARVLGAGAVLSGSVQKDGERLRIYIQLIDPADGAARWSQSYTRRETILLNLETEIATDVALQLKAQIFDVPKGSSQGASSAVLAAQKCFIQARALMADGTASEAQLIQAETLLGAAIQADPGFARAHAELSLVHTQLYFWGDDRTDVRLEKGLREAQESLRINSGLADAQIALGLYYLRGSGDFLTSLPLLERANALGPNNPDTIAALANLERRRGRFKEAANRYEQALALDPLNAVLAYNTADTFLRLREYEASSRILEHALQLMPGRVALVKLKGDLHLAWRGDLGPMADDILHRNPTQPKPLLYLMDKLNWLTLDGRVDEALAVLRASDFRVLEAQSVYYTRSGYEALFLAMSGQRAEAVRAADETLAGLEPELKRRPNDPRILLHAAQMLSIRGDPAAGERLARRTLTAGDPACVDAFDRGHYLRGFALLLALAGEDRKAIDVLRSMLAEPNQMSRAYLARHPVLKRYLTQL